MRLLAVAMFTLALCACGHEVSETNDGNDMNPAKGGEGFGDDHGKTTEIGHREIDGGYTLELSTVEGAPSTEGIFELAVLRDGNPVDDASVTIWVGTADGNELTPIAACEWMATSKVYDCHVLLPPDGVPAGARAWVRIRHDGMDERADFPFTTD